MSGVAVMGLASAEAMASVVDRHDDYRVLRRIRPMARFAGALGRGAGTLAGCALDVETTGLDHRRHSVIELAMQRFRADQTGRIVDVGPSFRWLEDPGVPIPAEITALTGVSDAAVAGKRICDAEAVCLILDADFVIAHNAGFDRPFVEARLPEAAGRPWICSMRDVDWRARGFEGRALSHLLSQMGWFYQAHRADADVTALLHLIDHRPFGSSRTMLAEAVGTAVRPGWMVEAVRAPFAAKDRLKSRGYRWDAVKGHWWREVPHGDFDDEFEWCVVAVYGGRAKPRIRRIDWTERYALD
ncbi:3'-5' exonuclease [Sphingomonas sp. R86521]|uniref:3'-5' exonuclease n=1 Tax=Sphingomonas sp. R86521 TaxID=3093860 RepID=UPI0036D2B525